MKYLGSKRRIAKEILPIILKDRNNRTYIEPFAGGMNMIQYVDGKRIANDSNYYLIELFKELQNGWIPPTHISKEEYISIKNNKEKYEPELVGFVGFGCSFGAKWFGGYARNKRNTNYALESYNSIIKQKENLKDVKFLNKDYKDLEYPKDSIIYYDPPYQNTTNYKNKFNSDTFFDWVKSMSLDGYEIYFSEYNAPPEFSCVWSKEITTVLNKNNSVLKVEKLYTYNF